MEEKRVPFSLKIRPQLKSALEQQAKAEHRAPANLAELLLEWAFDQLVAAGDSLRLKAAAIETHYSEGKGTSQLTMSEVLQTLAAADPQQVASAIEALPPNLRTSLNGLLPKMHKAVNSAS